MSTTPFSLKPKALIMVRNIIGVILILAGIGNLDAQTKKVQPKPIVYTEQYALECIQDYYEFYNADECYSEPKVRRVSNNVFYVSVKYCTGGKDVCYTKENVGTFDKPYYIKKPHEFFWHSKVLILTCTSKDKYTVRLKNTNPSIN